MSEDDNILSDFSDSDEQYNLEYDPIKSQYNSLFGEKFEDIDNFGKFDEDVLEDILDEIYCTNLQNSVKIDSESDLHNLEEQIVILKMIKIK